MTEAELDQMSNSEVARRLEQHGLSSDEAVWLAEVRDRFESERERILELLS